MFDGARDIADPGIPSAEREQHAAARAERRYRKAAAQRAALYIEAWIGWAVISGLVFAALVAL